MTVEDFEAWIKRQPLTHVRRVTRMYLGAVGFAKTPELKKLFFDLAEIGKGELERNKWSV
jgi:hypothetical protein